MTKGNKNLAQELKELVAGFDHDPMTLKHLARIENGQLTIQENPKSHYCIYFAAYDGKNKEVFIGHHKKSGLWLFNGGHIDAGETIRETLVREIDEEWGLRANDFEIKKPALLTITEIDNPTKQTCRLHYDIWYFIKVNKDNFKPDTDKLLKEFYKVKWLSAGKAREVVKEKNNLAGIDFIETHYF